MTKFSSESRVICELFLDFTFKCKGLEKGQDKPVQQSYIHITSYEYGPFWTPPLILLFRLVFPSPNSMSVLYSIYSGSQNIKMKHIFNPSHFQSLSIGILNLPLPSIIIICHNLSDPHPPLYHQKSYIGLPPPPPNLYDVIYERPLTISYNFVLWA